MDRLSFFFSFGFSYLRVPGKPRLGRPRSFGDQLSQKPLARRTFIVQNGPARSCVTRRATASDRAEITRLSPVLGSVRPASGRITRDSENAPHRTVGAGALCGPATILESVKSRDDFEVGD